jgi:hypothetical protein
VIEAFDVAGDFLQQAVPMLGEFLADTAGTAADAAAEEAGTLAVTSGAAGGKALWRRLRGRADTALPGGSKELELAAQSVLDSPDDQAALDQLHEQVGTVLASDPALLESAAQWSGVAGDYAGPRAVQTRDVTNSAIITGDNNRLG